MSSALRAQSLNRSPCSLCQPLSLLWVSKSAWNLRPDPLGMEPRMLPQAMEEPPEQEEKPHPDPWLRAAGEGVGAQLPRLPASHPALHEGRLVLPPLCLLGAHS